MNSQKLHWVCGVIIASLIALLLYQSTQTTPSQVGVRNLHDLGVYLRQKGLDLRGVPIRSDGLWVDAIYLTQTDRNIAELLYLNIDPTNDEKWAGTVVVFSYGPAWPHDTSDWGENGAQWGPFVFFGDKELLRQIIEALEKVKASTLLPGPTHAPAVGEGRS